MATKLFYNVSEANAESFRTNEASKMVIGFVDTGAGENDFGYILANGKQFGATKKQITDIVTQNSTKVSVDPDKNSLVGNGGMKYTLVADASGKLSISQYIKTTLVGGTTTATSTAARTGTATGSGVYVGQSYNSTVKLTVTEPAGGWKISYTVTNTTSNPWVITGIKNSAESTYLYQLPGAFNASGIAGANYVTTSGTFSYTLPEAQHLADSSTVTATGTMGSTNYTSGNASIATKTFQVFIHEKGLSTYTTANATLKPSVATANITFTAKTKYYTSTSEINAATVDTNAGAGTSVNATAKLTELSMTLNNQTPWVAFPAAWGIPKEWSTSLGPDGGWTKTKEINVAMASGATTQTFNVFTHTATSGSPAKWTIKW